MTKPLMMLFVAALLAGCDGGTATKSATTPDAPAIAVNKVGKAAGLDFTVTAVKATTQVGPVGIGPKAEAGETFVVVDYTLKNTADKPLTYAVGQISSSRATCPDCARRSTHHYP